MTQQKKNKKPIINPDLIIPNISSWGKMNSQERKHFLIYTIVIGILGFLAIVSLAFYDYIYGPESVFYTTKIDNTALRAIFQSIPKILLTIVIVVLVLVFLKIINIVVTFIHFKKQKSRTIMLLVMSLIRYVAWIIGLLLILSAWGVNTAGLIASASVVTVIIGLGTQSLIADVVAGIFIVFEGNIEVGDYVRYEGIRGEIVQIGLRQTLIKLTDLTVVRNSEIKYITNLSAVPSWACAELHVSNQENIERIDKIVQDNIKDIQSRIPHLKQDLIYLSADKFTDRSMVVTLVGVVDEKYWFNTVHLLNHEFRVLLEKNGIKFPES